MTFVYPPCTRSWCTIHLDWCPAPLASSSPALACLHHPAEQKVQHQGQMQNLPEKTAYTKSICLTITILLLGLKKWNCLQKAKKPIANILPGTKFHSGGKFPALCFPELQQTCRQAAGSQMCCPFSPHKSPGLQDRWTRELLHTSQYTSSYISFIAALLRFFPHLRDLVEKTGNVLLTSALQLT